MYGSYALLNSDRFQTHPFIHTVHTIRTVHNPNPNPTVHTKSRYAPVERHVVNGPEGEDGDEEEDHQLQRGGDAVGQEVADAVENAPRY